MNVQTEEEFPGCEEYDIVTGIELKSTEQDQFDEQTTEQNINHIDILSFSNQEYKDEWCQLFNVDEINLDDLRSRAVSGCFRASRFRSVYWRCLLHVLHTDPSHWLDQLETYRQHYNDLKNELEVNPRCVSEKIPDDNPLSQESQSAWQRYFCDQELKSVIEQDVIRTFPGIDFFRNTEIQTAMVGILFCYAKQNPTLCYRQGMHEILAPLLFVIHCDHQAYLHTREQCELDDNLCVVMDPKYLEEDSYTIFKQVMAHIESSYRIINLIPTSTGYFPSSTRVNEKENNVCENEVVAQLEHIKETILQVHDQELYLHLQTLDIPLQLFGIRWLRLLFGREFPLQDLLVLWDAIFSGDDFDLVNFIVVAMLIAIRQKLLSGDYTSCLTCLMRYPPAMDVLYVIQEALHLKNPQNNPKPSSSSVSSVFTNITVGGRSDLNRAPVHVDNNSKKISLKNMKLTNLKKSKPAMGSVTRNGEGDTIVEGFLLDDPALLKSELEHCHAVMGLVRLKLTQYHSILLHHIPANSSFEVQQALDGMSELCSLLKTQNNQPTQIEIEPAREAGELSKSPTESVPSKPAKLKTNNLTRTNMRTKSNTLPKVVSKPMKVFRETTGEENVEGAPMTDPLKLIKSDYVEGAYDSYPSLKSLNRPSTSSSN